MEAIFLYSLVVSASLDFESPVTQGKDVRMTCSWGRLVKKIYIEWSRTFSKDRKDYLCNVSLENVDSSFKTYVPLYHKIDCTDFDSKATNHSLQWKNISHFDEATYSCYVEYLDVDFALKKVLEVVGMCSHFSEDL